MLLHGLKAIHAVELVADQIDSRYYEFNAERWDDFIFSAPHDRLLETLHAGKFCGSILRWEGVFPFFSSVVKDDSEGEWVLANKYIVDEE